MSGTSEPIRMDFFLTIDGESIDESANTPNVYLQCVGMFYYRSRVNHS